MFPTPTLEPYGPLTTLFNPPASCIFTTTVLGSEAFIGYHPDLGTDLACFPTSATPQDTALPVSSSTLATSTISSNNSTSTRGSTETTTAQTTGPTSSQILGLPSLLRYYSPGICPVGYSYNTPCSLCCSLSSPTNRFKTRRLPISQSLHPPPPMSAVPPAIMSRFHTSALARTTPCGRCVLDMSLQSPTLGG